MPLVRIETKVSRVKTRIEYRNIPGQDQTNQPEPPAPFDIRKPETLLYLDPVVSVLDNSKMSDFKRCLRYGFYKHILGWKWPEPNLHLVHGIAWHEAMEYLNLHGHHEDNIPEAMKHYLLPYREAYSPAVDADNAPKNPETTLKALKLYVKTYKGHPDLELLHTEVGIPTPLGGDRIFHCKIDSLWRRRSDGKIFVRDYKTGSRVDRYWADEWDSRNQFFGYEHSVLCRWPFDQYGGLVVDGMIFYKSQAPLPKEHLVKHSPEQLNDWLQNVRYWYDLIKNHLELAVSETADAPVMRAFPRNDEGCRKYGGLCMYHAICHSTPNPLRYYQTPDDCPPEYVVRHWDPRTDPVSNKMDPSTGEVTPVEKTWHPKYTEDYKPDEVAEPEPVTGLLSSILGKEKK